MNPLKLYKKLLLLTFFSLPAILQAALPDGGMYPISMLDKVPLEKAGLRITTRDIYNPGGQGLMQAIVQIGGCTGSFVSGKGLIITNHHCAFGGLQPYSNPANNLMEKGYLAANQEQELPMKGLTCKIMESHKDVSAEILKGTEKLGDAIAKRNLINVNIDNLKQAEQLKNPDLQIDISEMLPGKSYILFRYKMLKDLRIVYIPARNIGEFGGETDNWIWPRHTGDFSFVRAYIGKDGKAAAFDSSNVPYEPKEFLNINAGGVDTGDFVFILGYPGRTYRHQPSDFLAYQKDYLLPFISNLYEWQINTIKELGESNQAWKISHEARIKSLANVKKNYQGKLKTIKAIGLYDKKVQEEKELLNKLSDPALKKEYGEILRRTDSLYAHIEENSLKYLWYNQLLSESASMKIARILDMFSKHYAAAKGNRAAINKAIAQTLEQLRQTYPALYVPYDSTYLKKMLTDGAAFEKGNKLPLLGETIKSARAKSVAGWLSDMYKKTRLTDSSYVIGLVKNKPGNIRKLKEPLIALSDAFYEDYIVVDSMQNAYKIQAENLLPRYVDIRMQAMDELFIPDANRTMRLTYGYIKGYAPRDAVFFQPLTTVAGMLAKDGLSEDYDVNDELEYIYKQNEHTPFHSKKLNDIPLCMLYNTDTTGGNSGSPVLNKFGQLVGLNFDRSYEGTINDYAWNDAYSRSIGLDIRFVLWVTSKVAKADYLIDEMFIDDLK